MRLLDVLHFISSEKALREQRKTRTTGRHVLLLLRNVDAAPVHHGSVQGVSRVLEDTADGRGDDLIVVSGNQEASQFLPSQINALVDYVLRLGNIGASDSV